MGKYEPLGVFLNDQTRDQIPMTFAEIEKILGTPLPASKQYPAWWSNNTGNNVMTKQWLDAGYQTESVNISGEKLIFRRVSEQKDHHAISAGVDFHENGDQLLKPFRHPAFGCMEGTVTIPKDVDLTEPAYPEWEHIIEEKCAPK